MQSLNTMRAILVASAVVAAIVAAIMGAWDATVVLLIGITAHGGMWWYIHSRGSHPTVAEHTRMARTADDGA